ncbi:MAG: family transporter [Rhodospirillales bacterium]|nr:family transporter [Rhodospirillales bacterium]
MVPVALRYFVSVADPLAFSAIRFGTSALFALPLFIWARPWRWPRSDIAMTVLCGFFAMPGLNIPNVLAARTIPAGGIGLLSATEPIFIIIFGLAAVRSGPTWRIVIGTVIALAGVALAMSKGTSALFEAANFGNVLYGLLGAASWGAYTVLGAPLARRYGGYRWTGGVLVTGGVMSVGMMAPILPAESWPAPAIYGEIAVLSLFSSLLGFLLWNYGAARISAQLIGPLLYLIPVFGIIGGVTILGEPLTWQMAMGGAVILGGVAIGEGRI